jgi:hypothetical protein
VLEAQFLLYANAWVAAGNSDAATVKVLLESDIRFWRKVLASSDLLITKMIAVAALKRHFNWSSAILRRLPSSVIKEGTPDSWSLPVSKQERSMLRCLIGEWKFANGYTKQLLDGGFNTSELSEVDLLYNGAVWFFVSPLFKPQDNSNRYAEVILRMVDILDVPYERYPKSVEQARAEWEERIESAFPSRAYNIAGDYIFASSLYDLTSYAVRVSDLEGIRRIAVAAAELRSRAISIPQISDELLNIATRNPYTGEPFSWDEEKGAIVFQGLEAGERGTHYVLY